MRGRARRWAGAAAGPRPRAGTRRGDEAFRAYADYTDTAEFRDALLALLGRLPVAVMCAETLWWRCHRRLIADAAMAHGVEVVHLLDMGKAQAHAPSPGMRIGDDGWPVYDVAADRPLF
jgi:uncharacterized protein (DUF488 family)